MWAPTAVCEIIPKMTTINKIVKVETRSSLKANRCLKPQRLKNEGWASFSGFSLVGRIEIAQRYVNTKKTDCFE